MSTVKTNILYLFLTILALTLGLAMVYHPIIFSQFEKLQTDPGDTRFNHYLLEYSFLWLKKISATHTLKYWDAPFFFPTENTLSFSDLMIGFAPFYWIFRIIGFQPETSFISWLFLMSSLNFIIFYFVSIRWLKFTQLQSILAAFLFAFAGARTNQVGHQQLIPQFYFLLSVHFFLLQIKTKEILSKQFLYSFLFWICLVLQFYGAYYYFWFSIFCGFFLLLISLPYYKIIYLWIKSTWKVQLFFLIFSIALISPALYNYFKASQLLGMRPFEAVQSQILTPQSWFHMGSWSWFDYFLGKTKLIRTLQMEHEHRIGLGLITSLVLFYGWFCAIFKRENSPTLRIIALAFPVFIFLATQFPHGLVPWKWVHSFFPGASALRAVSRIGVFLLFISAPLISFGFFQISKHIKSKFKILILLCLIIAEQGKTTDSYSWVEKRREVDALISKIPQNCKTFFFRPENPDSPAWKYQIDAMWAGLESGKNTLNGYSGNFPPGWALWAIDSQNTMEQANLENLATDWVRNKQVQDFCEIR